MRRHKLLQFYALLYTPMASRPALPKMRKHRPNLASPTLRRCGGTASKAATAISVANGIARSHCERAPNSDDTKNSNGKALTNAPDRRRRPLAAYHNLKDALVGRVVAQDRHIAAPEIVPHRFIGPAPHAKTMGKYHCNRAFLEFAC